ncbi:MAG TPA: S26 family signal peptidase [Spirochaetota bacterium]|nr:S26 family signal peptidase [Spirochaetota bacterium]
MKARVIVSATERETSPWLAALLSLLVTGLGQVYAGKPLAGIIFLLLRTMSIIASPFYSLKYPGEYMAEEILCSTLACLLFSIISPMHAFWVSRKKAGFLSWYNSRFYYSLYTLAAVTLTLLSVIIFFSFFNLQKVQKETQPLFRKGDIIAVRKTDREGYRHGDIVIADTGSGDELLRIIGTPGETISYSKGRFISGGSELHLSIFSEEELSLFNLTDYDVISEQNGSVRYPARGRSAENTPSTPLISGEYFLAPDSRESSSLFIKADTTKIRGRVDGIIFSGWKGILPGRITLPADNSINGM